MFWYSPSCCASRPDPKLSETREKTNKEEEDIWWTKGAFPPSRSLQTSDIQTTGSSENA
ncbi:hypothetical protein SK128_019337, partial [Halocaridina rubra]